MDIKTILLYVVVISVSAGLAFALFHKEDVAIDIEFEVVDDPLWYVTASEGARRFGLKKRLALMTSRSIGPERTGPIKEEIALLCRDSKLVDLLIDAYQTRPKNSAALTSAYMEIFQKIKDPRLTKLAQENFDHLEFTVRLNAARAALIQGHPRAISRLGKVLAESEGYEATQILETLGNLGGTDAWGVLTEFLSETIPRYSCWRSVISLTPSTETRCLHFECERNTSILRLVLCVLMPWEEWACKMVSMT